LLVAALAASMPTALVFSLHGKPIAQRSFVDLQHEAVVLRVFEPHEQREREYRAVRMRDLLTRLYGEQWKNPDDVLVFTCSDGYQPAIPTENFVQQEAYLALGAADQNPFELHDQDSVPVVPLGPSYLIWQNLDEPSLRADTAHDWPYQVVSIDLVSFAERYPGLVPPSSASAQARRGFGYFRHYCLVCHQMNGEGGTKGPDLSQVANRWKDHQLMQRFILNPSAVSPGSAMPGLPDTVKDREALVADIVKYLEAMATRPRPKTP
jgi:cytochrome c2